MARYSRRRRRSGVRAVLTLLLTVVLAVSGWWIFFGREHFVVPVEEKLVEGLQPTLTTDRPEVVADTGPRNDITEKGEVPESPPSSELASETNDRPKSLLTAGKQALERGDLIDARTYLSEALQLGLDEPDASLVRAELTRIGNETIFSRRIFDNDPLVARYIVQPGDTLGKIARAHHVSADLLADINGIADKNRIRAGQTIKIISGPFNAIIRKRKYLLEVYLGNTFVKQFKVGLGADDSTPSGEWRVGTKLINPTYYPPRGGTIIAADDPENPLGERWIGLWGTGGEAVGQERYGIHGTIEPHSIGRSVSLGCIRLYNEDVEALYTYLVEKHSKVTVLD